jgi:peptide subunit release factor 1 (eRF1)
MGPVARAVEQALNPVHCVAGGENGFSQAIELASDTLSNVKFVQEKRLISKFFDEISQDTGKYGFGVNETLQLMEMGAVETLVVWENLEVDRCILKNTASGEEVVKFLTKEAQQKSETYRCVASCFKLVLVVTACRMKCAAKMLLQQSLGAKCIAPHACMSSTCMHHDAAVGNHWCCTSGAFTSSTWTRRDKDGAELEQVESMPMLEWLAENYKKFGCVMEFVSDRSEEGSQFCKGFGGIGGLLRYKVDVTELEAPDEDFGEMWDEDEW